MGGGICDVIEAGINLFSNLFGNDPEEKQVRRFMYTCVLNRPACNDVLTTQLSSSFFYKPDITK